MKVIFLDIDGVLNFNSSAARTPSGYLGIAEPCVKKLKKIVDATGAKIVLTSTWKEWWSINDDLKTIDGIYMEKKLVRHGLHIMTKTEDMTFNRGEGIRKWLESKPHVSHWVVLDDIVFKDFEQFGILSNLVLTNPEQGLTDDDVEKAIEILGGNE